MKTVRYCFRVNYINVLFLPVYLTDVCSLSCLGSTDLLAHNDRAVSFWWLQIVNGGHPAGLEKG